MTWDSDLTSGQRSPDWHETLNAGTLPEKSWQWSDADVVFSAAYDIPAAQGSGSGSEEASSGGSTFSSPRGSTPERNDVSSSATLAKESGNNSGLASPTGAKTSALVVRSFHQGWDRTFELHHSWPRPAVARPSEVLIRNVAVGLNPVDFKSVVYRFGIASLPWVLGRDVAGVVEEVGSDVKGLAVGDRVWTCADSRNVRSGAYQAHCIAEAATVGQIPKAISDEEAATFGTGLVTAAIALYWFFQLPLPSQVANGVGSGEKGASDWLLIYGGGAVTGIYAAQLAAQAGVRVISVASPDHFEYLRAHGVTACVDRYGTPEEIEAHILGLTEAAAADGKRGKLRYALDCVGSKTADICQRALVKDAERDGKDASSQVDRHFIGLAGNPKQPISEGVQLTVHRISFSTTFYGDSKWSQQLLRDIESLLETNKLRSVPVQLVADGLAGVRRGLEQLKDGKAPRAKKLVALIGQTPPADLTNLGVRCELGWNGH